MAVQNINIHLYTTVTADDFLLGPFISARASLKKTDLLASQLFSDFSPVTLLGLL